MKCKIKGISVTLIKKTASAVDSFNRQHYTETEVTVNNVLIGEPTANEITSSTKLYGKKLAYVIGIPKGDSNNWEDTEVIFFNKRFKTFGPVIEAVEENLPSAVPWHKKVMVAYYE